MLSSAINIEITTSVQIYHVLMALLVLKSQQHLPKPIMCLWHRRCCNYIICSFLSCLYDIVGVVISTSVQTYHVLIALLVLRSQQLSCAYGIVGVVISTSVQTYHVLMALLELELQHLSKPIMCLWCHWRCNYNCPQPIMCLRCCWS